MEETKETKTLYLFRHGLFLGHDLVEEDAKSLEQKVKGIKEVERDLGKNSYVKLYTSPLIRAIKTAEFIQKILYPINSTVIISRELMEESFQIKELIDKIKEDTSTYSILISHFYDISNYLFEIGSKKMELRTGEYMKIELRKINNKYITELSDK